MKNYLIAGGSSGIGLALAENLAQTANVHIISRNRPEAAFSYTHTEVNVTDENPAFPEIESLDGIVFCPGNIRLRPFKSLKDSEYLEDWSLNFLGAVKVIRKYYPVIQKGGSIVLFSTVAVQTGLPFHASISSAKGAIEGLTRSLAAEFAPSIRVNCIAPSLTDTPLANPLISNEAKLKASEERHPLKRIGNKEDIASMAAFLLSDKSGFITGQIFKADGGLSALR